MSNVYAVILVGGKGKRLRPLSTDSMPKAFLSITKDRKTMFERTVGRIKRLIPKENIVVVANSAHAKLVRRDFSDICRENLILEPASRNTAPAIALAAITLKRRSGGAVMVVLPTDQYIADEKRFLGCVKAGIDFVNENRSSLLLLAAKPTYPATVFGYVKTKRACESIYKVEKFVEKPGPAAAKQYVKGGRYLWNTGAFLFTVGAILDSFKRFAPDIAEGLGGLSRTRGRYGDLPDVSIDYAVMEKAKNLYCIKGRYGWQDMGSFEALKKILKRESRDFIEKRGRIIKIL